MMVNIALTQMNLLINLPIRPTYVTFNVSSRTPTPNKLSVVVCRLIIICGLCLPIPVMADTYVCLLSP